MFVIGSFVADFSSLPDPDEFDEDFGSGYTHYCLLYTSGILYTPPKPDETENTFNLIIGNNGEWDEPEENELPE